MVENQVIELPIFSSLITILTSTLVPPIFLISDHSSLITILISPFSTLLKIGTIPATKRAVIL